jgi:hypothetical protein
VIPDFLDARLPSAIRTTIKRAIRFDTVPDDLAATVVADGREFVDRTLEAVERMTRTGSDDFERQVIFVTANFTFRHA